MDPGLEKDAVAAIWKEMALGDLLAEDTDAEADDKIPPFTGALHRSTGPRVSAPAYVAVAQSRYGTSVRQPRRANRKAIDRLSDPLSGTDVVAALSPRARLERLEKIEHEIRMESPSEKTARRRGVVTQPASKARTLPFVSSQSVPTLPMLRSGQMTSRCGAWGPSAKHRSKKHRRRVQHAPVLTSCCAASVSTRHSHQCSQHSRAALPEPTVPSQHPKNSPQCHRAPESPTVSSRGNEDPLEAKLQALDRDLDEQILAAFARVKARASELENAEEITQKLLQQVGRGNLETPILELDTGAPESAHIAVNTWESRLTGPQPSPLVREVQRQLQATPDPQVAGQARITNNLSRGRRRGRSGAHLSSGTPPVRERGTLGGQTATLGRQAEPSSHGGKRGARGQGRRALGSTAGSRGGNIASGMPAGKAGNPAPKQEAKKRGQSNENDRCDGQSPDRPLRDHTHNSETSTKNSKLRVDIGQTKQAGSYHNAKKPNSQISSSAGGLPVAMTAAQRKMFHEIDQEFKDASRASDEALKSAEEFLKQLNTPASSDAPKHEEENQGPSFFLTQVVDEAKPAPQQRHEQQQLDQWQSPEPSQKHRLREHFRTSDAGVSFENFFRSSAETLRGGGVGSGPLAPGRQPRAVKSHSSRGAIYPRKQLPGDRESLDGPMLSQGALSEGDLNTSNKMKASSLPPQTQRF